MPRNMQKNRSNQETELIGAALRYVAVADWFEARPLNGPDKAAEARALAIFNRIEGELRTAGGRLLRAHGHRALVLDAAGVPEEMR